MELLDAFRKELLKLFIRFAMSFRLSASNSNQNYWTGLVKIHLQDALYVSPSNFCFHSVWFT